MYDELQFFHAVYFYTFIIINNLKPGVDHTTILYHCQNTYIYSLQKLIKQLADKMINKFDV